MAEKKIVDLVIRDNVQETESHLKDLTSQINASKKSVDGLEQSFEGLNNVAIDLDATFEEVYGDLKPLTARMGEAEDRLYELSLAGKQGTAEFQALLTTVGNYRRVQIQTDLAVDSAATTMTQKLGGSLEYVSGAFAATQGALAIFGKENADVEKAILKVQSALAITQGFSAMREGANSVKQLGAAIKGLTLFQTIYNYVNTATTTGLKALRIALVSTGIGAIVIGVGLLIANFDKLKKVALNLVPGLGKVGDTIGGLFNSFTDLIGITSQAERRLDDLKKAADKTLEVNKKFVKEHGSQIDEYTKQKIDAKNEYAEALKEDGADQVALAKELNRKLSKIDKERETADNAKAKEKSDKKKEQDKEAKDKLDAYNKSIKDAIKAYNNEIADLEATTEQAKLDLWYARQQEEIRLLAKNEKDKQALLLALKNDYNKKQEDLNYQSFLRDQEARIEGEKAWDEYEQSQKDKLEKARQEGEEARVAYEKEVAEKEQQIKDARLAAQLGFVDAMRGAINALGSLFEQGTDMAKAAALADIAIGTATGFIQALDIAQKSAKGTGPGAAFAFPIFYASQVAAVLGAASRASAVLESGNTSSTGSASSAPVSAPPSFNVVGASPASANQIAQSVGGNQAPLKAYVVAQDVTTQQALNRNIVTSASLG
jgi:hypothetical protein